MIKKTAFLLLCLAASTVQADLMQKVNPNEKSPSREQVLWTETNVGYALEMEYDHVNGAPVDFGSGRSGNIEEHYTDIRSILTHRSLMAFLFHSGFEWQRFGFNPPNNLPVADQLNSLAAFLATDFRWSSRSLLRVQIQPGFYSDLSELNGRDFNVPLALAYQRVASDRFQWVIALSINTWRENRYLPGGGFRCQLNDRWKIKFMLPTPQIEYKANDYVHLWIGSDFRGDSYRVAGDFGNVRGMPALNNALVDYQELRVGTGFSWNIRPLIELNGEAGWLVDRSFNYHDSGVRTSSSGGAPYVSLNVRALFQVVPDKRPIKEQIRTMQDQFPGFLRFFKVPQ